MNASNAERTHIVFILDRSQSMTGIRQAVIDGWNSFLLEQQKLAEDATLSFVQFDTVNPFEVVHHFKPLKEVEPLTAQTYSPRGSTPLLDALGRGMNTTAMDLASLAPGTRPGKILFVVMTDGQENASRQYSKAEVSKMMDQLHTGGWQFVFLSSDMEAVGEAASYGFKSESIMQFGRSGKSWGNTMDLMNQKIHAFRTSDFVDAKISFSNEEREQVMDDDAGKDPGGTKT